MSTPLYVFDLDDTLIDGDCAMIWNAFLAEKGIATEHNFVEEDKRRMALYAQGKMDMAEYIAFAMQPLAHVPIATVQVWAEECVSRLIVPKHFAQASTLIEQLKKHDVALLIISASVSFLVKTVAQHLGIEHALGIDLVKKQGCYSGEIEGIASYREGKVLRLQQWLSEQNATYCSIHFYTDSINDLPLCQHADFAYTVNPCAQLKAQAEQQGWPILNWAV
ncbi:HAD-IB family hydrolase [Plesiomonas sp.]|uniref:HAD-IB family hydrolase n=1 Tax=Plesiomonas sp. TaxID=2486279 RepID=UPI003F3FE488